MTPPAHALYIGRFQPPHRAHVVSALAALEAASSLTLALGSSNLARSAKNPWTPQERSELWRLALTEAGADLGRVRFAPLADRFDADAWAADVRRLFAPGEAVLLVGYEKDDSSAYLRWFPGWERLVLPELAGGLNATALRRAYFLEGPQASVLTEQLPTATLPWLRAWAATPDYARLRAEWQALERGEGQAGSGREQRWLWADPDSGRIALHRRAGPIGAGLLELPGAVLPAGAEGQGTLYSGGGRSSGQPLVWTVTAEPPAELQTAVEWWLPAAALENPRQFYADHAVMLARLLPQLQG